MCLNFDHVSVIDIEVLLYVLVGAEDRYRVAFLENKICGEFQNCLAVSLDRQNIQVELIADTEVNEALADPLLGDLDLKDRVVSREIEIIDDTAGTPADRSPFADCVGRSDGSRVCGNHFQDSL